MRILVVLWTVCLISFCRAGCCGWLSCCCGKNKNQESEEPYKPVEQSRNPTGNVPPNGTSPEVQDSTLDGQPDDTSLNPTETQEEESPAPVEQSEVTPAESPVETSEVLYSTTNQHDDPSSENVPSEPGVINVSNPDPSIYQSFDYTLADNNVKLIIPKNGQSITKLMAGMDIVWEAQVGETLEYAKAYLNKDEKPELVHLVLIRSNGSTRDHYMEFKDGNWEGCTNVNDKINGLVTSTERKSDFTLDISGDKDTNNCTIFEVELLGVTTKHFFPKPGYNATKVKNGENDLWTGKTHSSVRSTPDDYCLSCIIYKKGAKELLEMTVIVSRSREKKYYAKDASGKWSVIEKKDDFNKKLKEMRSAPSSQPTGAPNDSVDSKPADPTISQSEDPN